MVVYHIENYFQLFLFPIHAFFCSFRERHDEQHLERFEAIDGVQMVRRHDNGVARRERSQSSMSRSFYIVGIDEGQATADYKDGVLSVHLPKTEKAEDTSHTIAVGGAA